MARLRIDPGTKRIRLEKESGPARKHRAAELLIAVSAVYKKARMLPPPSRSCKIKMTIWIIAPIDNDGNTMDAIAGRFFLEIAFSFMVRSFLPLRKTSR